MLVNILLLIVVGLLAWDFFKKLSINNYFFKYGINGTKVTLPLIGDVWLTKGSDTTNVFNLLHHLNNAYGKVYRLWIFQDLFVVVQDYKYLEQILRSTTVIRKNFIYDMMRDWLQDGLLTSWGHKWRARRKAITPSFHFTILEQFVEVFDQHSRVLVKRLKEKANGKTVVDLVPLLSLTTLDIITETAMGVKINAQENCNMPYVQALTKAADIIATRMTKPIYYYNVVYYIRHFLEKIILYRNIKVMHAFTDRIINERRKSLNESKRANNSNIPTNDGKKRVAFLDLLLQATVDDKLLSNQDIREEVHTFIFEGHDTTANAISFCCYALARHPQIQENVLTEVRNVLGCDPNGLITMQKLKDMKYLECVIKETLRLYPTVPLIGRIVEDDFKIDKFILPRGTNLVIPLYSISRDADIFPEPLDFVPERFLSDNISKINPYAYVPFSAGPRNCIGQKYAMLEMKCVISKLVYHYKFLPFGRDVEFVMSIILRSATGVNVGLMPRLL